MGLFGNKKTTTSVSNQTENLSSVNDAAGTVGDVYQGQELTITDYFSPEVANSYNALVELVGQSVQATTENSAKSLESIKDLTEAVKQPDVTLIQGYQKQIYYAIGAVALISLIFLISRK